METNDKKNLYGYIDEPIEGDNNNLREHFNYYIERIYKKLNYYFDPEIVKAIYPKIYITLCDELRTEINMNTRKNWFYVSFGAVSTFTVEKAIRNMDIFSDGCILSKGNFNDIQKEIVKLSLPSIITGAESSASYNTLKNGDLICQRHNINRKRYSLERLKATIEMQRCHNIAKRTNKGKMLIRSN